MNKAKILYIDDEEINLHNFSLSFEDDFEVLTTDSALKGLELFQQHNDIAVIIADQRMPGMNGVEMLTKIYTTDPDPIRIILTGYTDPTDIIQAINQGHIHQYINKPWSFERFRIILRQAIDKFNLTKENKRLIHELEDKNQALRDAVQQLAEELKLRNNLERMKREAEIKMMSQAKMASIGQISTGMAHEINQPLTYIKIVLESTARDLEEHNLDEQELQHDIEESQKQVNRITFIIDHLRTFGRNNNNELDNVHLPTAMENALILFHEKIKRRGITMQVNKPKNLPLITANLCKLEQVFTNLLQNSIDALGGRTKPTISVTFQQKNSQIITKFSDTGTGIPTDVTAIKEKIFEPFFTTKEPGKGTGLGLSIAYGIITDFNGTIECHTSTGQGCSFLIYLPIANNS